MPMACLLQGYHCYARMVESCSRVDISPPVEGKEWSVAVFQRALAHYHDQVVSVRHTAPFCCCSLL